MPFFPFCETNKHVGTHSFHEKHPARRIEDLKRNYFIMSRQHTCHECKRKHEQEKIK